MPRIIIKRKRYCLYSENKTQVLTNKRSSYCASDCLYTVFLTKVLKTDFKFAVLNVYYQRFSLLKGRYGKELLIAAIDTSAKMTT